jgi:hypothetical protein
MPTKQQWFKDCIFMDVDILSFGGGFIFQQVTTPAPKTSGSCEGLAAFGHRNCTPSLTVLTYTAE